MKEERSFLQQGTVNENVLESDFKLCLDLDGNLASVHSKEEYTFIQRLIRYEAASSTRAWIGGHDAVQEGVWLWSDGTKMNFQYWSPDEPDNWYNERCLELKYTNGYWDDDVCTVKKPFVCVPSRHKTHFRKEEELFSECVRVHSGLSKLGSEMIT
ncbi:galactose-specific lectin nattectin-like [Siphateles boraxobius]|uniref:galactose-specific lectin nattectin-like n=1 Tax=Siphateles boraxobius TaxID=180520 RepID=UPI004062F872